MSNTIICCENCSNHRIDSLSGKMAEQNLIGCSLKPVWHYVSATSPRECKTFAVITTPDQLRRAA